VIPRLESPRLLLREWRQSDVEPFVAMNADPRVMEFFPKTLSPDESLRLMEGSNLMLEERRYSLWAAERLEDGAFLGFIGLAVPSFEAPFTPCVEVGWRLRCEAWGQGYATEGAARALDYAWKDLGLTEVLAFTSVLNFRSLRVMERLGMRHDVGGDFEHPRIEAGHRLRPHVLYRISRPAGLDA
jgi:RimJ/RimL family protein N-acetyltransferase